MAILPFDPGLATCHVASLILSRPSRIRSSPNSNPLVSPKLDRRCPTTHRCARAAAGRPLGASGASPQHPRAMATSPLLFDLYEKVETLLARRSSLGEPVRQAIHLTGGRGRRMRVLPGGLHRRRPGGPL